MKKAILALTLLCSVAYGQKKESKWGYKVGLVSPLPIDVQLQTRVQLRSFMGEVSHKLSPKVDLLMNGGYLMFSYRYSENFDNIVVLPGFRYNMSNIYFGANCGLGFFSEAFNDNEVLWSPFVGVKGKKISADIRYFNWRKITNDANTLGIVISYIL